MAMENTGPSAATGVRHMKGGTGPGSFYALSKSLGSSLNEFFWPQLSHSVANALQKLQKQKKHEDEDAAFAIADFGCSCALSTVHSMHFIAKCLLDRSCGLPPERRAQQQQLDVQAFFNDLPSNDFNALFGHLCLSSEETASLKQAGLNFMPCGIPGSFYSRLFPARSLHIGLCTLALHNLSQVPNAVRDHTSSAWNENRTWILDGCKAETGMAYRKQFQQDFTCFLRHRSEELVPGGLLFCVMIAAKVDDKTELPRLDHDHLDQHLETAWRQLVGEGLLEQATLDESNLPIFTPTVADVMEVLSDDVALHSKFEVEEVEYVEVERAPKSVWMESAARDGETWGNTCETMARNFWGSLIQAHLKDSTQFEMLMQRLRQLATADDPTYRSSLIPLIVMALSRR